MCGQNSSPKEKSPAVWIKKSQLKVTITQNPATWHRVLLGKLFSFPTKRRQWPTDRRGANSDCEGKWDENILLDFSWYMENPLQKFTQQQWTWEVNELLLVESQERLPIVQKFLRCTNASREDDCNLVKPKIRRSGSFKKQNTRLVLH